MVQQPANDRDADKAKGDNNIGKVGVVMPAVPLVLQLKASCAQVELYTEHLQSQQAVFSGSFQQRWGKRTGGGRGVRSAAKGVPDLQSEETLVRTHSVS